MKEIDILREHAANRRQSKRDKAALCPAK